VSFGHIAFFALVRALKFASPFHVFINPSYRLAIEGVQPTIPQNVAIKEGTRTHYARMLTDEFSIEPSAPTPATTTPSGRAKKRKTAAATSTAIEVKPQVKHVLSKELQLYFEKITTTLKGTCTNT
jgi:transcription initiation factor TFIID subunit 6